MKSIPHFNNPTPWTAGQKIAFRFFFIYLTLQVLTENFLGPVFGFSQAGFTIGASIFTRPCLWLNRHFFHFNYIPAYWSTFSESLHTIRDILYLLLAMLACLLWSFLDRKRTHYVKLHYWFSQALVIGLSGIVFAYAVIKICPLQMPTPSVTTLQQQLGDLNPFRLLWATFGYGKPYQVFSGLVELSGAILILFRRTRLAGLLIIVPAFVNIILLNYSYQVGVMITSFYILFIALFLLVSYGGPLWRPLFAGAPSTPQPPPYRPGKNFKTTLFRVISYLILGLSFFLSLQEVYKTYRRVEAVNRTRQYSLIKQHIVNNDSLPLTEKDTLRWRVWGERITGGKRMVSIITMNPSVFKTYSLDRDTVRHVLTLRASGGKDTIPLKFNYTFLNKTDWELEGIVGQSNLKLELQRILPDSTFPLLKKERRFIVFDDLSDGSDE